METISAPPHAYSLMNATRYIGYSFETAVADLIDNSISAQATEIDVLFNSVAGLHLAILDNGNGMTYHELCQAMRYGSSNPIEQRGENDLGRYGLGLKTASLSQCKKMTVASFKDGVFSACQWDLDALAKLPDGEWALKILTEDECKLLPSMGIFLERKIGTIVIWQQIDCGGALDDANHLDEKLDITREHLALVFHRYLYGDEDISQLTIRFNGSAITPKDPFLQHANSKKLAIKKGPQMLDYGVSVTGYILPHEKEISPSIRPLLGIAHKTLRQSQGFYIYRNKRLITSGGWFSLQAQGEFFKLARVQVDIPNTADFAWSLDVKKSIAKPPKKLLTALNKFVKRQIMESEDVHITHVQGRPQKSRTILPWTICFKERDVSSIIINREYPVIKDFLAKTPHLDVLFTLLERTLPLDAIQLAKRNEKVFENEQPIEIERLISMLRNFVRSEPVHIREDYFDRLLEVDPCCVYKEELRKHKEMICAD